MNLRFFTSLESSMTNGAVQGCVTVIQATKTECPALYRSSISGNFQKLRRKISASVNQDKLLFLRAMYSHLST